MGSVAAARILRVCCRLVKDLGQGVLALAFASFGRTARMRSIAFSSVCLLQAKDRRMWHGAPKPEPGTTATPALLIRYSEKALSSRRPRLAIAPRTSANA